MAWRVARSLDVLLGQVNEAAPRRSKVSDGAIGDAAHASRDSDHNPWISKAGKGVVTARDFTHDPAGGLDCDALAAALVRSRDPRIKYIIWNRRILSGARGPSPWVWRPYSGTNPHSKHLHLSVESTSDRFDDARGWAIHPAPEVPREVDDMFSDDDRKSLARLLLLAERQKSGIPGEQEAGKAGLILHRTEQSLRSARAEIAGLRAAIATEKGIDPAELERIIRGALADSVVNVDVSVNDNDAA